MLLTNYITTATKNNTIASKTFYPFHPVGSGFQVTGINASNH